MLTIWTLQPVLAQRTYADLSEPEAALYDEHIFQGQPVKLGQEEEAVYVRQGYVLQYHEQWRIPNWIAYHIIPDYINTPKREKKYKKFRRDPDLGDEAVRHSDYTNSGYARGHMAPYFAMGGDRDGDGIYSDLFEDDKDLYDDRTVFQANYMSNIAPQDHDALNGAGGPWYTLETAIRNKLIKKHKLELYLIVGTILSEPSSFQFLVTKKGVTDIMVPDRFYQVLITEDENGYHAAGFLFPHVRERAHLPSKKLLDYLVPVDSIEQVTGYDFFVNVEAKLSKTEKDKNMAYWKSLIN